MSTHITPEWIRKCEWSREYLLLFRDRWNKQDIELRKHIAGIFYNHVYSAGQNVSGYLTKEAVEKKYKTTDDHCFSPRMMCYAIMDVCPEVLDDPIEFSKLFDVCRTTVKVTQQQNNTVKFGRDSEKNIFVTVLTEEKYDSFRWFHKHNGYTDTSKGFPLKHLIPKFFTEYERSILR